MQLGNLFKKKRAFILIKLLVIEKCLFPGGIEHCMCLYFHRTFNSNTNNIQTRVTKLFSDVLSNEKGPLATHYGAMSGLGEMGTEVISNC